MYRAHRYEKPDASANSIQALSDKLVQELRNHIRELADYPVLSEEWKDMAESVKRIGDITESERKMPKKNENATLWECEELALRYILEDGKLNLCLRLLQDYQAYVNNLRGPLPPSSSVFTRAFETGMCSLLKNAWLHVEALQTTDIPLLIEVVRDALIESSSEEKLINRDIANTLPHMISHFLFGLLKHVEEVGESRIMPLLMEHRIFPKLVQHLHRFWRAFSDDDNIVAATVLAIICDTEDFQTRADLYVETSDDKASLLHLRDDLLEELLSDYDTKKKLRPLMDYIKEIERACKRK